MDSEFHDMGKSQQISCWSQGTSAFQTVTAEEFNISTSQNRTAYKITKRHQSGG